MREPEFQKLVALLGPSEIPQTVIVPSIMDGHNDNDNLQGDDEVSRILIAWVMNDHVIIILHNLK